MTREVALTIDSKELNHRVDELSKILDAVMGEDWDIAYDEYCMINSILNQRYREENLEKFEQFFYKNIYCKEWADINGETWDCYSDWHKDMFGYRPKSTDKDW